MDSDDTGTDSGAAQGADTLLDVLQAAAEKGFGHTMTAVGGGSVSCDACGRSHRADALEGEEVQRLEGASDPADMLLVAWIRCPTTGEGATLTLGFGPNATRADAEALELLRLEDASQRSDPVD